MIIAITAIGKDLKSQVDQRFGRAKFIIIYDTNTSSFTAHDNLLNLNAPQGAGIQSAQNIVDKNAEILLTGNLGPKAFTVLSVAKIKSYLVAGGTVEQAIKDFQDNKLELMNNANVEGHW